jgi:hypothetical protein
LTSPSSHDYANSKEGFSSSNLNIFSEVNKKSTDSSCQQELVKTDTNTQKSGLYLFNSITNPMDEMHSSFMTGAYIQEHYRLFDARTMNQSIRRMYKAYDKSKPIDHITLTKLIDMDVSDPDKLRLECRNVLRRIGVKVGFIFGMDMSAQGVYHFHTLTQGCLKPHNVVLARYGWGYIKLKDDANTRNEFMHMDEENTNRINGFHASAKYCLTKKYPNKKAFLKI